MIKTKLEQSQKQDETPVRSALSQAQRLDEALSKLLEWTEREKVPTSQELQGLPKLTWQLNNQLKSLQLLNGFLCQKIGTVDNEVVLLQIVPPSITHEILSACHSSSIAGHLGVAKTSENVKQRFHWSGLQEDTKLFVIRCPECQKSSGPPKTYHHSLMEWQASYPFQHIGIFFGTFAIVKRKQTRPSNWLSIHKMVRSHTITRSNSYHNCQSFS